MTMNILVSDELSEENKLKGEVEEYLITGRTKFTIEENKIFAQLKTVNTNFSTTEILLLIIIILLNMTLMYNNFKK